MYSLIQLGLLALGLFIGIRGISNKKPLHIVIGALLLIADAGLFLSMYIIGDVLWFDALGYAGRYWRLFWAHITLVGGGAVVAYLLFHILTLGLPRENKPLHQLGSLLAVVIGALWGGGVVKDALLFIGATPAGEVDPIYGKDVAFYMLKLPFYQGLHGAVFAVGLLSLAANLVGHYFRFGTEEMEVRSPERRRTGLFLSLGLFYLLVGLYFFLQRFDLLLSPEGAVFGAGWTDLHVRLPVYWLLTLLSLLSVILIAAKPLQRMCVARLERMSLPAPVSNVAVFASPLAVILIISVLLLGLLAPALQQLRVEPNEITVEEPYIERNIAATRQAFGMKMVEERQFPATGELKAADIEANSEVFRNIRLWDWRALIDVYRQFQEIRLYYDFNDVDIDRYHLDGQYREVMVSAREMEIGNLSRQSQTFVNEHFIYTHGIGVTLASVSEFTDEGLPRLWVKDIPPKSEFPELEMDNPEIYYGERTDEFVVGNSREPELHYPKGDENVYAHYAGSGGVPLDSLWKKFLYGWKMGGTRFFLSSYPTRESRLMFHRQVRERVNKLAPFLHIDNDPYIIIADGGLKWIVDAYVTSEKYPYSEPFHTYELAQNPRAARPAEGSFEGKNYLRNAVKITVDAYSGDVNFYVFAPKDPVIQAWSNVFPDLFKPRSEMPKAVESHIRYPVDLLLTQALMFSKYHMTDPNVFYNQEDLWVRATEKYYGSVIPVEPYYVMWRPPGSEDAEFSLILPFTPKNRQVLIGWMAGLCDGENYGRLLAYQFPKERRVLGPQQVETKIDQDSYLSGQLTLWDQRGSQVIRGNVLAIPVQETVLYVEPIYLKAETAAYPELRLVVVMHENNLSYAETFDEAIAGLFEAEGQETATDDPSKPAVGTLAGSELAQKANQAFEDYLRLQSEKQFETAGSKLEELRQLLEQMAQAAEEEETEADRADQ